MHEAAAEERAEILLPERLAARGIDYEERLAVRRNDLDRAIAVDVVDGNDRLDAERAALPEKLSSGIMAMEASAVRQEEITPPTARDQARVEEWSPQTVSPRNARTPDGSGERLVPAQTLVAAQQGPESVDIGRRRQQKLSGR